MNLPLYCILYGERAVKAVKTDYDGIPVFEYYAEDDAFTEDKWLLDRILFRGPDVEYVTAEEFNEFLERQGSKGRSAIEAKGEDRAYAKGAKVSYPRRGAGRS